MTGFVVSLDRRAEKAYIAKFKPTKVDAVLKKASAAGAMAAKSVVKGGAPTGTSRREGQFYRRTGLGHGTFASSISAKAIRHSREPRTVGHVIGPMGKKGFTRAWREFGTKPHHGHPGSRGLHWLGNVAGRAFAEARVVSERFLVEYGSTHG